MIVVVGSKNRAKLAAVENAFGKFFKGIEVIGAEVESGVASQPLSLEETVEGAVNRARAAWEKEKCDFSVGMEAGLLKVQQAETGFLDAACCAVFDGKKMRIGLTPAFEYPKKVVEKILKEGKEVSEIFNELWEEDTRDETGAIGRLSKGIVPRSELMELGLLMALAPIANEKHYGED